MSLPCKISVLFLSCIPEKVSSMSKTLYWYRGILFSITSFSHSSSIARVCVSAASLLLQPISLAINILGHYRWTHPKPEETSDGKNLNVSSLNWTWRLYCMAGLLIVAGLWGWSLDRLFPADPHPYLDSCVTVLILLAQLLSALKKWDCWIAWLLVNVTQIVLHLSVGNVLMSVVSALYLVNGIWSLVTWLKLYRNKA